MRAYIALLHKDEDSEYGLSFPDFPGCVGAGVTAQAAVDDAIEALTGHIELLVEEGQAVPEPSSADDVLASGEANGGMIVYVPAPPVLGKSIRVNITLPDDDLVAIDQFCKQNYLTRSGFILSACRISIAAGVLPAYTSVGEPVEDDNNIISLRQATKRTEKGDKVVTNFVTRIELRNATAVQYVQLHADMIKAGFTRTIPSPNGQLYHLPTAEYFLVRDNLKLEDVRDLAQSIASAIAAGPLVLVTSGQSTWSLVPVSS